MITEDRAFEIAHAELAEGVKRGGLVTLLGYADHWKASCTFPDGGTPADHTPKRIRIALADGAVSSF